MARDEKAALPPLPPKATGKPKRDGYRQQHGVIVICDGEEEQKRVYEGLAALAGAKLKVVAT